MKVKLYFYTKLFEASHINLMGNYILYNIYIIYLVFYSENYNYLINTFFFFFININTLYIYIYIYSYIN